MPNWQEQFNDHPAHGTLQQALAALDGIRDRATESSEGVEAVERLERILKAFELTVAGADPYLVAPNVMDNANQRLEHLRDELTNFVSDSSITHLEAANSHAGTVSQLLYQFNLPKSPEEIASLGDSISSFRRSVSQHERYLNEDVENFRGRLGQLEQFARELDEDIKSQKSRVDAAIAEFQKQFSEAESTRSTRSAEAETKRAEEFATAKAARKEEFDGVLAGLQTEADKLLEDKTTHLEELSDAFAKSRSDFFNELERYKDQAKELVQVIGNTGLTGGYQKAANSARNAGYFWQTLAILSLVGFVALGFYMFVYRIESVTSIEDFLARAFVTGSVGVLARYSANQANKNRRALWYNRRMELELASVDPYIAFLKPDKQVEIKEMLFDRVFGRGGNLSDDPRFDVFGSSPASTPETIAAAVSDFIVQLFKRGP